MRDACDIDLSFVPPRLTSGSWIDVGVWPRALRLAGESPDEREDSLTEAFMRRFCVHDADPRDVGEVQWRRVMARLRG